MIAEDSGIIHGQAGFALRKYHQLWRGRVSVCPVPFWPCGPLEPRFAAVEPRPRIYSVRCDLGGAEPVKREIRFAGPDRGS